METRTQFFVTELVAEMDSMPTLANSAALAHGQEIKNLRGALVRLGPGSITPVKVPGSDSKGLPNPPR